MSSAEIPFPYFLKKEDERYAHAARAAGLHIYGYSDGGIPVVADSGGIYAWDVLNDSRFALSLISSLHFDIVQSAGSDETYIWVIDCAGGRCIAAVSDFPPDQREEALRAVVFDAAVTIGKQFKRAIKGEN